MSVQSEIDRIKSNMAGAYAAVSDMGGTLPALQNSANLEDAVRSIPSGGAAPGTPLDPVEVYQSTRPADWLPMPTPADNEMYLLFHIPDGASSLLAFTVTCTGSYNVALGTVSGGQFSQQSVQSISSGGKYEAELFASDCGNLTSGGMKQVMVRVSGTDILTWNPSTHSKKTSPANFSGWSIVEISCKLPNGMLVKCGNASRDAVLNKLRYFSWYGANNVTDMSDMFANCNSLTAIPQLDTSNVTDMRNMFANCNSLTAIPQLDTSNVTDMSGMFYNCNSLTAIPPLDTSNVTDMSIMFYNCNSLTAIPPLDTSNVTNMNSIFSYCNALTTIPQLDTSNVDFMGGMFSYCNALTTIPQLDTSNVTNTRNMFYNCSSLTAIPQLDTSNVTNMSEMFSYCKSLTAIPQLDTSNVTNTLYMFNCCFSLAAIPQLDTSNVTNMSSMFANCNALTAIPQLDTSSVTNMSGMFYNCPSLATLALKPSVTGWAGYAIDLSQCSLGHAAIVALFDSLPGITSSNNLKLTGNPGVSELSSAEKAIATGKNWTLTL